MERFNSQLAAQIIGLFMQRKSAIEIANALGRYAPAREHFGRQPNEPEVILFMWHVYELSFKEGFGAGLGVTPEAVVNFQLRWESDAGASFRKEPLPQPAQAPRGRLRVALFGILGAALIILAVQLLTPLVP